LRLLALLLLTNAAGWPQEFEVAAVKPHARGAPCGESNTYSGGRLILACFSLYEMIREALNLQPGQTNELTGGPAWVTTELWDLTAKAGGVAGELAPEAYRPMLLNLVKQQFKLKLQSRKQQVKGFQLIVDRSRRPNPGLRPNSGAAHMIDVKPGVSLTARRVSMTEFAAWLKMPMAVAEHVDDRTDLRGEYDFDLKWTPASLQQPGNDAPTIFTALREQMGLRLRPARVHIDAYVIEAAERRRE